MSGNEIRRLEEETEAELEPFLEGLRTKEEVYDVFEVAYNEFEARFSDVVKIKNLILEGISTQDLSKVEKRRGEINSLFLYLGYVKGFGEIGITAGIDGWLVDSRSLLGSKSFKLAVFHCLIKGFLWRARKTQTNGRI